MKNARKITAKFIVLKSQEILLEVVPLKKICWIKSTAAISVARYHEDGSISMTKKTLAGVEVLYIVFLLGLNNVNHGNQRQKNCRPPV